MQSSLKTGWLLVAIMASSVVWSGCFDPPQLPEYVTEMADLDDPNVTKTEWEQQKAAEAAQDAGNQADDDVTDNDASATGPDGSVEPTCTNGDPCDSEGDTDKCEDDVWTLCESEDPVCQNVIGTVCEIDGVCVDAGSHNPENTCLVCDPGEAATASTDWTPIETGKLCDEHGLFGTCEPDGLGGMECTEQPDWLFCDVAVPPTGSDEQCVSFEPWGGHTDGDLRFVAPASSDETRCPSASIDATLKDALERESENLKWGSVILLEEGEHQACDVTIPAGVTLRSVAGPALTRIVPEDGGCDQEILRVEAGADVTGLSVACDAQEGCADLTLLKVIGGDEGEFSDISHNIFIGGKRSISTETASGLYNNTFYNGKSGIVVEAAAAEDEISIHSSLFWSMTAHGISAEAQAVNVTAEQNVYIKTSNPTKQVTDSSPTANGENISGAEFDSETYTAKDANTLSKLIAQGDEESDIGAVQSQCGWDVRAQTWRCAHAVGTTNQCITGEDGSYGLAQLDACAEMAGSQPRSLQDAINEAIAGSERSSGDLLLEPGIWEACNVDIPNGLFLIGAAGPDLTTIRCNEPLPEACTEPAEGAEPECPTSRVLTLHSDTGLVGLHVEVIEEDMGTALVPAIQVAGANAYISHLLLPGYGQGIGIELSLPKYEPPNDNVPTPITLEHLTLGEHHRAIWVAGPEDMLYASAVRITLNNSVISWSDYGVAHHESVTTELETQNNHFCGLESGAYVTLTDADEVETNALPTETNDIKGSCPDDWEYRSSAEFEGVTASGHDLGAIQTSCEWYEIEAPESDCCYPHTGGSCEVDACAETVCQALPECCSGDTWTSACSAQAAELCGGCGCVAQCGDKSCGSDGCDGFCGDLDGGCSDGSTCDDATGQCSCVPDCEGKSCGDDGCGGVCGECQAEGCMESTCEAGTCTPLPKDCDDGDPCTQDGCADDTCTHTQIDCDDQNDCTIDDCEPSTGQCDNQPVEDGDVCDDDNLATALSVCLEGQCGCVPDCGAKQCGDDGCGGSCGACVTEDPCSPVACDITTFQCVIEPVHCDDDNLCTVDVCTNGLCDYSPVACDDENPCTDDACDVATGDCTAPNAQNGTACDDDNEATTGDACVDGLCGCLPQCDDKTCGDDGCGGTCGACVGQDACEDGQCVCQPSCAESNACGGDGCGGDCGACPSWETCLDGQCACVPDCLGKDCGSDGCDGSCGECTGQDICQAGECVCEPSCDGKTCGDDGCGGNCGSCAPGVACIEGVCFSDCVPSCGDKECGSDGCNSTCGTCSPIEGVPHECIEGYCEPYWGCEPECDGLACGDDGCGGNCGVCGQGSLCVDGACIECTPSCGDNICGPDGCGGECGSGCEHGSVCTSGTACESPEVCDFSISMTTANQYSEEMAWVLRDSNEDIIANGFGYEDSATYVTTVQLPTGSYTLEAIDGFGDGWNVVGQDATASLVISHLNSELSGMDPVLVYTMEPSGGSGYFTEEVPVTVDCDYCVDSCAGRLCGASGCGGQCGECVNGEFCTVNSGAQPMTECKACTPDCDGKECGDDGCGGYCGATLGMCEVGLICQEGSCEEISPVGPPPGELCDAALANMPHLPLPSDSCNPIGGVEPTTKVVHVSHPNPSWCPDCSEELLSICGVMPSIEVAIEEFAVGAGDIILVHHGHYTVNQTEIPAGVRLRAIEGPAATSLVLGEGTTTGVVLKEHAVMEGFWIGPGEGSVISEITTFVDMLAGSDGASASNRLEFNIIGGLPDSSATNANAVRVRGAGSEVFHNTFTYSQVGVSFDQDVTLINAVVTNNVFNNIDWPVMNHPATTSCSDNFCAGTSTPCTDSIECSILMAPLNNHVYCSDEALGCAGEDPLFTSDYIPSTAPGSVSPLIGASTVDGKDLGAMQSECGWGGCSTNCTGDGVCSLDFIQFPEGESCSPVDYGQAKIRVVVHEAEVGPETVEACEAYTDLKEALDASTSGDIVLVYPGEYAIDDCAQSAANGNLSALVVPAGVRLMSTHGASETRLHLGEECTDFMQISDGATVEGFMFHGPSDVTGPQTRFVSLWGDDETEMTETFRFNVLYGEQVPYENAQPKSSWGIEVNSTSVTISHNTFINQVNGVEFTEPNGFSTSTVTDNIFIDNEVPVRTGQTDHDVSSTNVVSCPSAPSPAPACQSINAHLNEDFFPTEASGELVIEAASDSLDMGANQLSCAWSSDTGESESLGEEVDWGGCEQAPALTNGCAEQSPAWDGEPGQVLTDYGLCLDHDEMGGRLFDALTVADEEDVTSIILGPGEWESCGLTLGTSVKVLSAMGPEHTRLVCKDEPTSCTSFDDPDCPSAGVLELGSGSAALSGFNVLCLDGACKHDIPAIKMTGPDSMLSHLIVTAPESTAIEISLPEAESTAYLHLRHLTVVGNAVGMLVEHPTETSYEKLQVNLFESVFAKNQFAILHLSPDVDAMPTLGQSINAGNVLIGLSTTSGIDDQGHVQLGIPDVTGGGVVLASYIPQHLNGIEVINTSSASEAFNQWADGGYQDPNISLPPELTDLESADLGAIQEGCAWLQAAEPETDGSCVMGDSECVPQFNSSGEATCVATEDLGFTFPDAVSAGHFLRAVIDNLVDDGVTNTIIRIGDGEWDVCTASSPTDFSDNTVSAGLQLPSGFVLRADNGPSVTRITCPEVAPGEDPSEVVRLAPGSGLIGLDVDCGALCDEYGTPTIHVTAGESAEPTLLSYVSATGGAQSQAVEIASDTVIDHCHFYESFVGVSVVVSGNATSPQPEIDLHNTIFSGLTNSYWAHNGNWTDAGLGPNSYSLTSGSNYGCAVDGEGPGVTDFVLGDSGLDLDYEVTCDACVSNPPEEWVSNIPQADCSLWMSGTSVLDMNTEAPKATHCGPMQGNDGCIYPLEFED